MSSWHPLSRNSANLCLLSLPLWSSIWFWWIPTPFWSDCNKTSDESPHNLSAQKLLFRVTAHLFLFSVLVSLLWHMSLCATRNASSRLSRILWETTVTLLLSESESINVWLELLKRRFSAITAGDGSFDSLFSRFLTTVQVCWQTDFQRIHTKRHDAGSIRLAAGLLPPSNVFVLPGFTFNTVTFVDISCSYHRHTTAC
jgi:hypothetical protein